MRRVVQAAREPGDAYAFGRHFGAVAALLANPFDQASDRYRHFAWKAGAKEGARTDASVRGSQRHDVGDDVS
jgi:hypothetical protein